MSVFLNDDNILNVINGQSIASNSIYPNPVWKDFSYPYKDSYQPPYKILPYAPDYKKIEPEPAVIDYNKIHKMIKDEIQKAMKLLRVDLLDQFEELEKSREVVECKFCEGTGIEPTVGLDMCPGCKGAGVHRI